MPTSEDLRVSKKWISFGSRRMTEIMGNIYRLGYWFMVVGLLFTFL